MNKDLNILYDYLLHFNPHIKRWNAIKREDKEDYFNGTAKDVVSHEDVNKLIGMLLGDVKLS